MNRQISLTAYAAAALFIGVSLPHADAQIIEGARLVPLPRPAAVAPPTTGARPATTKPQDGDDDSAKDPSENLFPGGAALKTDPEQQRLLKRADQCVTDGRLDLAAAVAKVLTKGDTLMIHQVRTSRRSHLFLAGSVFVAA
jgi:hypothetical protein